jgi:Mce-associated membrane protein
MTDQQPTTGTSREHEGQAQKVTGVTDEQIEAETIDETRAETAGQASDDVDPADRFPSERGRRWGRALAFGVLPAAALILAMADGYAKWLDSSLRDAQLARAESVRTATESTIALLSYKPDTVDKDLNAARDRLTGNFRDAYTQLTHDVVIPGSRQKKISAVANVAAAASLSATQTRAVVLLFIDQTTTIGNDPPTNSASSVRVTLDKVGDRWMVSDFTPV